ncbi:MAG: penicillin-binding protein 2 [Planctomycetota bacterium]
MSQRRIILLIVLIIGLLGILEVRLFSLQMISGSYYREQAQKRTTRIELIPALRGKIRDRHGRPLVQDTISFDLYLVPREVDDRVKLVKDLSLLLKTEPAKVESELLTLDLKLKTLAENKTPSQIKKITREHQRQIHKIFSNISFEVASEIESASDRFSGIIVKEKKQRRYLYQDLACHTVGYMKQMNETEYRDALAADYFRKGLVDSIDESLYHILLERGEFMDDQIGGIGVEKICNDLLNGRHGLKLIERDLVKKQQRELNRIAPEPGADIFLTIDLTLQKAVEDALKNKTGSIVVMDVNNGEILALASHPAFDPNKLQRPVLQETVNYMNDLKLAPGLNRVIGGAYPLGSIFKLITAVAALEEQKITTATSFNCDGYFSRSSKYFKCWVAEYQREHGMMNLENGIQHSCNVYFFNIGKNTGVDGIGKWARNFGFGQTSRIDLIGEKEGLVPDQPYHLGRHKKKWYLADTLNLSIGQGDLMVTPLQVCRMMAAVANNGSLVRPHVLKNQAQPRSNQGQPPVDNYLERKIDLLSQSLSAIKKALYKVVHESGGTAHGLGLDDLPVAGKTSTAQTGSTTAPHAWFAGFAPYDNPRFAFVIMVEKGGKGSAGAAVLAPEIITQALNIK